MATVLRGFVGNSPDRVTPQPKVPRVLQEAPHPAIWDNPGVAAELRRVLGPQRLSLLTKGWGAGSPLTQPVAITPGESLVYFFVCKPHSCNTYLAWVFLRLSDGKAQVCWQADDKGVWLSGDRPDRPLPDACDTHDGVSLFARQDADGPDAPKRGKSIAYSRKNRLEVFASGARWCDPQALGVQLDVVAADRQALRAPEFGAALQKVGQELLPKECPAASVAHFQAFVGRDSLIEGMMEAPSWTARVTGISIRMDTPAWGKDTSKSATAAASPTPATTAPVAVAQAPAATAPASPQPAATVASPAIQSGAAAAPARYPGLLATLDIGGIRLGMAPSETKAALRAFDAD